MLSGGSQEIEVGHQRKPWWRARALEVAHPMSPALCKALTYFRCSIPVCDIDDINNPALGYV